MAHFRFRPECVEAVRWTGQFLECDPATFPAWVSDAFASNAMHIASPTTTMVAAPTDWIVKRGDGSLQPFTQGAFDAAFEPVT